MKVKYYEDVPLEDVNVEGAKNAKIRWLISQKDDAPTFSTRMFEIEKDGNTPYHTHTWEHEIFILEGQGIVKIDEQEYPLKAYDSLLIKPNVKHQFINNSQGTLKFLCIIPHTPPKKKNVNPFANVKKVNNC